MRKKVGLDWKRKGVNYRQIVSMIEREETKQRNLDKDSFLTISTQGNRPHAAVTVPETNNMFVWPEKLYVPSAMARWQFFVPIICYITIPFFFNL